VWHEPVRKRLIREVLLRRLLLLTQVLLDFDSVHVLLHVRQDRLVRLVLVTLVAWGRFYRVVNRLLEVTTLLVVLNTYGPRNIQGARITSLLLGALQVLALVNGYELDVVEGVIRRNHSLGAFLDSGADVGRTLILLDFEIRRGNRLFVRLIVLRLFVALFKGLVDDDGDGKHVLVAVGLLLLGFAVFGDMALANSLLFVGYFTVVSPILKLIRVFHYGLQLSGISFN